MTIKNFLLMNFWKIFPLIILVSGCATRYVARDTDHKSFFDNIGDVVIFNTTDDFLKNPPICLGVLPVQASKKEFNPTDDLRKALHAQLAPSGISLVPLQRIDLYIKQNLNDALNLKNVSAATGCDTLITSEITDRQARFLGVYSEVKIGASIRIHRVSTGAIIWSSTHTAVIRDGGLPINPISIVSGSISAGLNLRDEQVTRASNDLARRLITAIPNLKFTDKDSDLLAKSATKPVDIDKSQTVHAYITSIQNQNTSDLVQSLTIALNDKKWSDPNDRLVLSDFLLKTDSQSTVGMYANANAKLEIGQADESFLMTNRLLLVDNKNPEFHFLKGRILLHLKKPSSAIDPLLKAAASENSKAIYFTALGVSYNQLGFYKLALSSLKRSLQLESDNPFVLLQMAIAHVGMGSESEAVGALRKSMISSIILKDLRNAERALSFFKSLVSSGDISPDEMEALELKISNLLNNS